MGTVERRSRQSRIIRVTLANLDLRQRVIRDEAARQADKMRVPLDSKDGAGGTDPLTQEVQNPARTATEVENALARVDANLLLAMPPFDNRRPNKEALRCYPLDGTRPGTHNSSLVSSGRSTSAWCRTDIRQRIELSALCQ